MRSQPFSEQEFTSVVAKDKMDLSVLGVANSDERFISDRAGQPLVILYGVPAPPP